MKMGLFLGAGASSVYDKPTTVQFKEKLQQESIYGISDMTKNVLDSILAIPEFEDVEHILQSIKETIHISENWSGKYFTALQKQQSFSIKFNHSQIDFEKLIYELKIIQTKIEDQVFKNYCWNHEKDQTLRNIFHHLIEILMKQSEQKIIFTTNYDRAVERFCELNDLQLIDGFIPNNSIGMALWDPTSFNCEEENHYPEGIDANKDKIYLYKLHGSLTWKHHTQHKTVKISTEGKRPDAACLDDYLIYPTLSPKGGQELEPYKTIHDKFLEKLNSLDVCIVVGFSFRDDHIKKEFRKFIEKTNTLLIVISFSAEKNVAQELLEDKNWSNSDQEIIRMGRRNQILCINSGLDEYTVKHVIYEAMTQIISSAKAKDIL